MNINIIYDYFNAIENVYDRRMPTSLKAVRKNTNNEKDHDTSIICFMFLNNNNVYKTSYF